MRVRLRDMRSYFLIQAALAYWPEVSPYDPIGSTAALAFVLAVSAVKAIIEVRRRAAATFVRPKSHQEVLSLSSYGYKNGNTAAPSKTN
jgi:hypothetical protein